MSFRDVKVGDIVTRSLAGAVSMKLYVSAVTEDRIICGEYQFDRNSGAEEDSDLNWGVKFGVTGSYLIKE